MLTNLRQLLVLGFVWLLAVAGPAAAQAPEIAIQRNLEYGRHDGASLVGDLYSPKAPGKYPAVIAVHGGGWQGSSKASYQYWGPWLAQRGYVVFSIDYRLVQGGKKMYPESVHDVRAAVQFIRSKAEDLRVDPDRIGMMGDSAGGHLVAMVALAGDSPTFAGAYRDDPYASVSTKVKAVVGAYGVYDMIQQWNHDVLHRPRDNIVEKYLGVAPMDDRKLYFEASPMSYALRANSSVSFLITHGTEDDIVDRTTQSDAFLLALKQSGHYARHIVMQGSGHFWMSDPIEEPDSVSGFFAPRVLRFLAERL